jgi:hypothetical protein
MEMLERKREPSMHSHCAGSRGRVPAGVGPRLSDATLGRLRGKRIDQRVLAADREQLAHTSTELRPS